MSLEVSFKKERHEPSSDNDSLFVHDGSAIRDLRSNMDIDDPNEQPLKRTVAARTPRSPHESQTVSPHSGRPNKTKQRSNKKGVTSRKVQIKDKPSEAKPKSASKGGQLKDLGDPSAKGQQLGSKFTFATLTHGPYHMKEVVQVRVSQRIL